MKTGRWLALIGCGALWSVACGSSFSSEADGDSGPNDGTVARGDVGAADARQDAGGGAGDGSEDGQGDDASNVDACGANATAPVCLAEMRHIAACSGGAVPSCECAYLNGSCAMFADNLSDAYKTAYLTCATTPSCDPLAVDDCVYYSLADAGLTSPQQKLLRDYCATCEPTNAECAAASYGVRLFAAEFTNAVTTILDNDCATQKALAPYIAAACASTTDVTSTCCLAAFKTCEADHGLAPTDDCDGGGSLDAGAPREASLPPDAGSKPPTDASSSRDGSALHDAAKDVEKDAGVEAGKDAIVILPDVVSIGL